MSHRTVLATAATLIFLQSQPGEFTAEEIRRLGQGFHVDNDTDDIASICGTLSNVGLVRVIQAEGYVAYSAAAR